MLDRTLFVLGRAICVAAPAGLVIWLFANITIGGGTILTLCTQFLDPFAKIIGLDGVILIAFILGLPANEFGVQFCKCFKLTDTKRFEKHLLTKHIDF